MRSDRLESARQLLDLCRAGIGARGPKGPGDARMDEGLEQHLADLCESCTGARWSTEFMGFPSGVTRESYDPSRRGDGALYDDAIP